MSTTRCDYPPEEGSDSLEGLYAGLAHSLQCGDTVDSVIRGHCMQPAIRDGQRVTVRKQARYYAGDIVLFADFRGNPLIHRYLGPAPGGRCMTRADVASKIDILVPASQVLGKAICCDGRALPIPACQRLSAVLCYLGWVFKLMRDRLARAVGRKIS